VEYETESRPRVVLMADGRTAGNHLNNGRLLTPIKGVPLLIRTIQQFGEWANVAVLSSDPVIRDAVKSQRSMMLIEDEDKSSQYHGVDFIRKGLNHCYKQRSLIVFGDVVFTDEAVEVIRTHKADDWAVFGRSTDSPITGTPWAEFFAIEVNWLAREHGKGAVEAVAGFYNTRQWPYCTAWEWYYHMEKMPYTSRENVKRVKTGPHWVEINDGTDDIDFEVDRINLMRVHG
jgi:hypothetical protein